MSTTFQQAREAVAAHVQRFWREEWGTLWVAPYGRQDATHYQVPAGPRENLKDGDPMFAIMDWPIFLVDRATGQVEEAAYLLVADRLESMAKVGEWEA